ncbi:MAG: ribonuclease P protein component [Candidatus Taylorbacteria bacterium]|nr:ribonuclease P protein component [Candidatus Taylorbacteria bacterium]
MNNKEVITVITQGRAFKSGSFLLKMAQNKDGIGKHVAILAPKKQFPTAVMRNKAKRRLKSCISACLGSVYKLPKGYLYVFTVYKGLLDKTFKESKEETELFLTKNGIL